MFCKKSRLKAEFRKLKSELEYSERLFNKQLKNFDELMKLNYRLIFANKNFKKRIEELEYHNKELRHDLCIAVEENKKLYDDNFNLSGDKMLLEDRIKELEKVNHKENTCNHNQHCVICARESFAKMERELAKNWNSAAPREKCDHDKTGCVICAPPLAFQK